MKKMKKFFALMIAMVMVLAMAIPAMAEDSGNGGNGSITITLPTEKTAPTKDTVYEIYKVFDATNDGTTSAIAYTSRQGETMPDGFVLDTAGNVHHGTKADDGTITDSTATALTEDEIAAIARYVRDADLVYTATVAKGTTSVEITGLEYGYYYITTSSGTAVTITSTNPSVSVKDKNIIPIVKKSAGTQYDAASLAAIAAVGKPKEFTAQINVGHGTKNLVFTDEMTNMTYDNNVVITVSAGTAPTEAQAVVAKTATGFTVTFNNDYIAGLADNTIITLNYSGTVTSAALSNDPATNKASITSGDKQNDSSDIVKVYNAKFTVSKKDGNDQPLAGAGFVIQNEDGKYYKLGATSIEWVDTVDEADTNMVHTSDANGAVAPFMGLGDGTYTLVEYIVPSGYNKAADETFIITSNDYTGANLEQSSTVTNQAGSTLPSTGGIGTTIFYVVGAILVVGAGVVMITRRRMDA